ncbi:MAG: ABC transporter permease [Tissierellia bacterium]|nr:ABC transporter permease [Tissierellia bacterium]
MIKGLYYRLAKNGIKNNRELYLPFTLASSGTFALFFIILAMAMSETFANIDFDGMQHIQSVLFLGSIVVGFFSIIFIFYTHSFLIENRKKEFALYQVLGMEKKHIRLILIWENLILYIRSLIGGLVIGTLLYKVAETLLFKLAKQSVESGFLPNFTAFKFTIALSAFIYLIVFLNSIRKVQFTKLIELLNQIDAGEKKPKINWVFFVLSIVLLLAGYYLAITSNGPIVALKRFFIATMLVIAGTEFGFIAISVFILKNLQKNKKYYYKPKNFTNVSGMIKRMTKNGVGLANITIIATAVIILISTAVSLSSGIKEMIKTAMPNEISIKTDRESFSNAKEKVYSILEDENINYKNKSNIRNISILSSKNDGEIVPDNRSVIEKNTMLYIFVPVEDLNENGQDIKLSENEIKIFGDIDKINKEKIKFGDIEWKIIDKEKEVPIDGIITLGSNLIIVAIPEIEDIDRIGNELEKLNFNQYIESKIGFDTDLSKEKSIELSDKIKSKLQISNSGYMMIQNRYEETDILTKLIGGVVYTCLFLGLVFMVALALIIYYKQLTEGYEDLKLFTVMQNVGMTKTEIKSTINSQIKMVFLIPLIVAGVHMAFAFPMIRQILEIFYITDTSLYIKSLIVSLVVFVLIYIFIYILTSKTYYRIVTSRE